MPAHRRRCRRRDASCCATRTARRCRRRSRRPRGRCVAEFADRARVGIHPHNDAGCGVANALVAIEAGALQVQGTTNGLGERTGNANLTTIIANLALKMGHEVLSYDQLAKLTETAHFLDELLNRAPDPRQPYVGKFAFAHKGGLHVAGGPGGCLDLRARGPGDGRQQARPARSASSSGRGTVAEKAAARGHRARRRRRGAADRARQGARARRLPLRGRRRLVRAADAQGGGRVRAAVPPGVVALHRREARRRQGRDARPPSRSGSMASATCAPPRATARSTRWTARCAPRSARSTRTSRTSSSSTSRSASSTRRKGTDAVTRVLLDTSDGHDSWGSIGVNENIIAASWEALVDSLEYAEQPARTRV